MRRVVVAVVSAGLFLSSWGCGKALYEARLQRTLQDMEYRKRLDENLMPPPTEGGFTDLAIFVRPPRQEEQTKVFNLGALEPGAYDLAASFLDTAEKHSSHVLARRKSAKKAPAKGAPPASETPRGPFVSDVLGFLGGVYGVSDQLAEGQLKTESKKANEFRRLVFATNVDNVPHTMQVFFYKKDDYDTALMFLFPTADQAKLSSKINLTLESFAVGTRALNRFQGAVGEDDAGAVPAGPSVAF